MTTCKRGFGEQLLLFFLLLLGNPIKLIKIELVCFHTCVWDLTLLPTAVSIWLYAFKIFRSLADLAETPKAIPPLTLQFALTKVGDYSLNGPLHGITLCLRFFFIRL